MSFDPTPNISLVMEAIDDFLGFFPDAHRDVEALENQLYPMRAREDDTIFDRSNMDGHVTASAFIVNRERNAVALIHHNFLQRELCPGGHVDPDEQPFDAAIREAAEEIGLDLGKYGFAPLGRAPIDIETHAISARPARGEGHHRHHDMIFLFLLKEYDLDFKVQEDEVSNPIWLPLSCITSTNHVRLYRILKRYRAIGRISNSSLFWSEE